MRESPIVDPLIPNCDGIDREEGDSGIDANSQGSCSSNDVKPKDKRKDKKKKKTMSTLSKSEVDNQETTSSGSNATTPNKLYSSSDLKDIPERDYKSHDKVPRASQVKKALVFESSRHPADREEFEATGNETYIPTKNRKQMSVVHSDYEMPLVSTKTSPKQAGTKREEGWKEVSTQTTQKVKEH